MGFWHTGYGEFHEPVGLNPKFKPQPKRFLCKECDELYPSPDELRNHQFEAHPRHRPVMLVQGRELGKNRVRITKRLSAADVHTDHCARALLNDRRSQFPVSLTNLPKSLPTFVESYWAKTAWTQSSSWISA